MGRNIINEYRVLKLNNEWQPIGVCSVRRAIKSMTKNHGNIFVCASCQKEFTKEEYLELNKCDNCKGELEIGEDIPFMALHIDYPKLPEGGIDYQSPVSILPVKWEDWIHLPIRSFDKYIRTSNDAVRIPTVIITENYGEIPKKTPQYSSYEVAKRDNNICQYTNEYVPRSEGNIDHVVPRDLGGETSFENCVWTSKRLNELKANMHPDEFFRKYGYKLIKKPTKPSPRIRIINRYKIRDWDIFLKKENN